MKCDACLGLFLFAVVWEMNQDSAVLYRETRNSVSLRMSVCIKAPKSPRLCYVCGKWCSLTSYHENHSGMFPHCSKRAHRNSFTAMNSRGRYEPCRWLLSSKWLFFQRVPLSWLFDIQRMENNQRRGVLAVWNRRNRCSDSVSRHQWLFASLKRLML